MEIAAIGTPAGRRETASLYYIGMYVRTYVCKNVCKNVCIYATAYLCI